MDSDTLPLLPYTDSTAQGLPPPYTPTAYIARPDAALPPGYNSDWSKVQADVKLPWFIKTNQEAFISYLKDRLLLPPQWFLAFEEQIVSTGEVQQLDPQLHWCLRLLFYQPNLPPHLMASDFARQIFCEIIWITLTPKPYEWFGGCQEIERRTGWDSDKIKKWFVERSTRSISVYRPSSVDPQATIARRLVVKSRHWRDTVHVVRIRPAAAQYLSNPNLNVQWDDNTFEQCVTHWLKDLADQSTALNHFFLNPLYERPPLHTICGIHVGPFDWSDVPMRDLWVIEHDPRSPSRRPQDIGITPYNVVPAAARRYDCRIFRFIYNDDVRTYMRYWTVTSFSGRQEFRSSGVAVSVYNHMTHR